MTKVIFKQHRGNGNPSAFYVIDRRVPAMQVPAFYVTPIKYATAMDLPEAFCRVAANAELRALIGNGAVTIEEVAA